MPTLIKLHAGSAAFIALILFIMFLLWLNVVTYVLLFLS